MIALSLKHFLVTEQRCPDEWRAFDLYLFRDRSGCLLRRPVGERL